MTGKLIKYEIKSSIKLFGVIWAALLAAAFMTSVVSGVFSNVLPDDFYESNFGGLLGLITVFIYIAIFVALVVVTTVIIIMRFYKGLLGEEGYLMHTLPVKPHQHIIAKGTVATGIVVISILVAALSILLLNGIWNIGSVLDGFKEIVRFFSEYPESIVALIELIILMVASIMISVYQVYAALAIGQLSNKYRLVISFAAYMGIGTILSFVSTAVIIIISEAELDYRIATALDTMSQFGASQLLMIPSIIVAFILLIIFHVITERLLATKLNLQ